MSTTAREVIDALVDPGSFRSWQRQADDAAVLCGEALVGDRPAALLISDFSVQGGSIGSRTAQQLVDAIQTATRRRLPLVASTASGGTRMQDGSESFVRMIDIGRAVLEHRAAELPYLVHLRSPTTGGVLASWAALGQVTLAEPGALIGFLGPRVVTALIGQELPAGVQVAENLAERGVIDQVVSLPELRARVAVLLDLTSDRARNVRPAAAAPWTSAEPWAGVVRSRGARLCVRDLLTECDAIVPLSGTGEGERSAAIRVALVRMAGISAVLVAQDIEAQRSGSPLDPAALRTARRGVRLAADLGLPLVTVIDTSGARPSAAAENGAFAREIGLCIDDISGLPQSSVAVLLGEGGGGGALALFAARTVLATPWSWLAPLPPEGASMIVHGDTDHAAELAGSQGISAVRLQTGGRVEKILDVNLDQQPGEAARRVLYEIRCHLLAQLDPQQPQGDRLGDELIALDVLQGETP